MRIMKRKRKRAKALRANQLETALRHKALGHPETDRLVQAAALLEPAGVAVRETRRAEVIDKVTRLAELEWAETRADAGSRDGDALPSVHTARVDLPDGRVYLADVEPIGDEKAVTIAADMFTAYRPSQ